MMATVAATALVEGMVIRPRILGIWISTKRSAFTGNGPTIAKVKYCKKKARPKVTRMAYSPGRSTLPPVMGFKNITSNKAPSAKVTNPESKMAMNQGMPVMFSSRK
jgi:hypothetical protein